MMWQKIELGDLCSVITKGTTPKTLGLSYSEGGVPFLRAENLQNDVITLNNDILYINHETDRILSRSRIFPGDVLISIAGTIGRVGIVPLNFLPMNCNQAIAILRIKDSSLHHNYLLYWLNSDNGKKQINNSKVSVTISNLSLESIRNLVIDLPPLPEQKRIAAILDKADALRRKRQESIRLLDELLRSVFLELFGDPVRNEKGWEVKELGDVSESRLGKMRDEKQISGKYLKYYLGNSHVKWFTFDLCDLLQMDFNEDEQTKYSLKYGDLLICEGGEIGRCAIWKSEKEDCYFQKALHRVRVNRKRILPEYLQYVFFYYAKFNGFKNVTAQATIAHLTGEKLKTLSIPIPQLTLQNQFAHIVEKVEHQKQLLEKSLAEMENNFNSLMQQAFRGEL